MESRPSSSSVAKSPVLINSSSSASFNGHLLNVSGSSSQRRLRALSKPDSDELSQHVKLKSLVVLDNLPENSQIQTLPLYSSGKVPQSRSHSVTAAHWLLVAYCLLSVAFFTMNLVAIPSSFYMTSSQREDKHISPINEMPAPYRLSKLLQAGPREGSFFQFISSARLSYQSTDVTACLWVKKEEIRQLDSWSSSWNGPLSIVVATDSPIRHIIKELEASPALRNKANIHVVQKLPNESFTANVYLNFARLFSETRFAMLYPGSPETPIPDKLYRRVSMHANKLNATRKAAPLVLSPSKSRSNNPIPFSPLSPLLIERSYPIWCSERFFTAPSRDDAWEECLWQIWLNSYGHLSTPPGFGWKVPSTKSRSEVGAPTKSEEIIHRRLSNRFRHESCVLAAKRLKDRPVDGKVDPRKSQWLRKTCRQVMTGWAKALL